jgi:hypothetical protein
LSSASASSPIPFSEKTFSSEEAKIVDEGIARSECSASEQTVGSLQSAPTSKGKYKRAIDKDYKFSVDKLKKKMLRAARDHVISLYKEFT